MGSSRKEVSSDHHETDRWSKVNSGNLESPKPSSTKRQQQQQSEVLVKCPRCESTNTKFCYYNNYNKTQPRHFCKACKRHWTNGGTLRNVPVGGGRKNKRLKRPNPATTTSSNTMSRQKNLPLLVGYQKCPSNIKMPVTKPIGNELSTGAQSFTIDMLVGSNDLTWDINGSFMNPTLEAPRNPSIGFASSSTLSSFDPIPISVPSSLTSLNCYEGGEKLEMLETGEDSTITSVFPSCGSSTIVSKPWEGTSTTNSFIDSPNYWNWNIDVDAMVLSDLNIPWDDSEFNIP